MAVTFEKTGVNDGVLKFSIDQNVISKGLDVAFKKIKKNITAPGFRKGHVPRKMFNRLYGEASLYEEALNEVLPDAYEAAVDEAKIEPVSQPKINVDNIEPGKDWELSVELTVKPEVKLGDYKGLKFKKESAEVTDEDVDNRIEEKRQDLAEWVVKEDVAANGDTVVIDFVGSIAGEEFDGGSGTGYSLELGSGQFIPGFEDQLVGHKSEDEVTVKVTFPDNYSADNLAGKEAEFAVTIHEVKSKELPELDDEFAKDADDDVETLADLKAKYRQEMEEDKAEEVEDDFEEGVVRLAVDNAEIVEIPQVMIDEEVNRSVKTFLGQMRQQGISPDLYYQLSGTSPSDLIKQYSDDADFRVKTNLVVEAIAKAENITVDEDEIDEEVSDLSEQYNIPINQVKNFLTKEMVEHDVRMKKAISVITDSAIAE